MKVLVTGGAGFIGSHVVDTFLGNNFEVVVVDDLSTGHDYNLNPKAAFYKVDIRSPQMAEIFEKERPDFVDHHAAQMDVRKSVVDPLFDADVNVRGSINVIECARRYGVKHFVYISTGGAVYGEPVYLPCDEDHPINPICPYGASKHTVEHYLYMYHVNYGLNYTVLRYPNVYGPRQDPHGEAGVVAIFTGKMLKGEQCVIHGDGENTRDYVYVGDCAKGNLLALTVEHKSGIFNLGSGIPTSVNQIFHTLKNITGYQLPEIHGPGKLGETRYIYLKANKAQQELGWQPTWDLEKGLQHTVESLQLGEKLS
jgi:UDP-glucose 4-epimerase